MASGRVRIYLDSGIASIKYASVDANGVRSPTSGYSTSTSDLTLSNIDHFYIASCTLESGYEFPWEATYSGSFESSSVLPDSGTSSTVNANIYPKDGLAATVRLSATAVTYDSINATIVLNGIEEVRLKYIAPDGIGYTIYFDESENPLEIKPNSDIEILSITSFSNGYGNPVYAQGSGNPWDISTDNLLEFGSSNKTFTLTASSTINVFPFTVYTYLNGTRVATTSGSEESSSSSTTIDLKDYVSSSYYDGDYNYLGYSKSYSGSKTISYSVSLTSTSETTIYVWYETPVTYYPYRIYVYVDGDHIDDYDKSSTTYEYSTLNLNSVLSSSLFSNYELSYYTKGSSSTKYTNFTNVGLSAGSTTYIYVYLTTTTYTVTFKHYLGSSTSSETTTSVTVAKNATVYPANHATTFTHYKYSYATNSSGTKITSISVTSNVTIKLYYELVSYTITFRHMLGDSSQETIQSIKATSTITLSNYAGSYSGYTYDHAENSDGDTITTLTITKNTTVYLIYIIGAVEITFNHYRGNALYTTTTTKVNSGTTITTSNYKITTMPNCVYNSASTSSFTATTNKTVNLYYLFAWTYAKTKGVEFNLTATEWNNLIAFVNAQRTSNYSFTTAVKGNSFTAAIYNEMVNAIGVGTTVSKGDIITAALMNQLVANANNM